MTILLNMKYYMGLVLILSVVSQIKQPQICMARRAPMKPNMVSEKQPNLMGDNWIKG
jgi:hypothetical protein